MYKKTKERQYAVVTELRRFGHSYRVISEKTGISKSTVGRLLLNFDPERATDVVRVEKKKMKEENKKDKKEKGREVDSSSVCTSRERSLIEENTRLKAELKEARREADFQSLRAEVFDEMIKIAERELGIAIRKKSGVKR